MEVSANLLIPSSFRRLAWMETLIGQISRLGRRGEAGTTAHSKHHHAKVWDTTHAHRLEQTTQDFIPGAASGCGGDMRQRRQKEESSFMGEKKQNLSS